MVFDYTYDGVMRSHDASLERLGVAAIDILLIHDVDVWTHGSQAAADEKVRELFDGGGYRALEELKAAGRIAAVGAGVNEWQACEALLGHADFDCFLLAGRYTLIEQEALTSFLANRAWRAMSGSSWADRTTPAFSRPGPSRGRASTISLRRRTSWSACAGSRARAGTTA